MYWEIKQNGNTLQSHKTPNYIVTVSNTAINNLCQYNEQCGKTNDNNTTNAADGANTAIPIAPMYDANASNDNGGNRNVLDLTDNTQVIEDNHIVQKIHTNYVRTLTDIMVWMVDNMPENVLIVNPSKGKT